MRSLRVHIVGAGVGGLAAHIALRRVGIESRVFESAPSLRTVGSVMTVWPNAMRALARIGIAEHVLAVSSELERLVFLSWRGIPLGEIDIAGLRRRGRAPIVYMQRETLLRELYRHTGRSVHFDARCREVVSSAHGVSLRDVHGRTMGDSDVVVAADGIRSAIRAQLLNDGPPRSTGQISWFGQSQPGSCPIGTGAALASTGYGGMHCWLFPMPDGRVSWFMTFRTPYPAHHYRDITVAELAYMVRDWQMPIAQAVAATHPDELHRAMICDRPASREWGRGRVTFVGDAIHPSTPDAGQGACQAVVSAWTLARELSCSGRPIEASLRRYEAMRQRSTAQASQVSWFMNRSSAIQSPALCALRDLMVSAFGLQWTNWQLGRIVAP